MKRKALNSIIVTKNIVDNPVQVEDANMIEPKRLTALVQRVEKEEENKDFSDCIKKCLRSESKNESNQYKLIVSLHFSLLNIKFCFCS